MVRVRLVCIRINPGHRAGLTHTRHEPPAAECPHHYATPPRRHLQPSEVFSLQWHCKWCDVSRRSLSSGVSSAEQILYVVLEDHSESTLCQSLRTQPGGLKAKEGFEFLSPSSCQHVSYFCQDPPVSWKNLVGVEVFWTQWKTYTSISIHSAVPSMGISNMTHCFC